MNGALRLIGKLIAFCLVPLLPIPAAGQATSISLSAGPGAIGGTIAISVALAAGSPAPTSVQWDLTFTASELSPVSGAYYATGTAATAAGKSVNCNPLSASVIRCLASGLNATAIGNGILATVTLQIAPGTNDSASPIGLQNVSGSGASGYAVTVTGSATTAALNSGTSGTWIQLVAANSGKCLTIQDASLTPGAPTEQLTCSGSSSQSWQLLPAANGAYEIVTEGTGFSLDVRGESTAPGAIVQQWPYWGGPNELWLLQPASGGYYNIVSVNSGLCLDVTGGPAATQDGVPVQQWTCNGGTNQQWEMVPPQWVELVAANSSKCLTVQNASLAAGAPTEQLTCSGTSSQLWQLLPAANGAYEIVTENTGFSLDVRGESTEPGAIVQQWPYWGGSNEQWLLQPASGGYYNIVSVNSGLCLDVTGGPAATQGGILVQQWTCNGGTNQQWEMLP